jgi:hypothetical protein
MEGKGGGGAVVSTIRPRAIADDRQLFTVIPLVLITGTFAGNVQRVQLVPTNPSLVNVMTKALLFQQ